MRQEFSCVRMGAETETYPDEQLTTFESEPMNTSGVESMHEHNQVHAESREEYPTETHVSDVRGGERELWNVEFAGEGNYRFEDGQIINNETGESLASEIERTHGAEEAAVIEEGQRLLTDESTSTIRTPMYVEEGPDKTTFYDTQYIINKDGSVGYEIRSYSIAKRVDEESVVSYESSRMTETHERQGFVEMLAPEIASSEEEITSEVAAAAYAEKDTRVEVETPETYEHPQEIEVHMSKIAHEDAANQASPSESGASQSEERADNWLQAFFDREPLELTERETPENMSVGPVHLRTEEGESTQFVAQAAETELHVAPDANVRFEERPGEVHAPEIRTVEMTSESANEVRSSVAEERVDARPGAEEKIVSPRLETADTEKPTIARRNEIARAEVQKTRINLGATERPAVRPERASVFTKAALAEKRADSKIEAPQRVVVREPREKVYGAGENQFRARENTVAPRSEVRSRALERERVVLIESARIQSPELLRKLGASQRGGVLPTEEITTTRRTSILSRNGITLRKAA